MHKPPKKLPRGMDRQTDTVRLCFVVSDELDSVALSQLGNFVLRNMEQYFSLVGKRVEHEQEGGSGDTVVLVRALDRFHRRLQAMNTLFSDTDFAR